MKKRGTGGELCRCPGQPERKTSGSQNKAGLMYLWRQNSRTPDRSADMMIIWVWISSVLVQTQHSMMIWLNWVSAVHLHRGTCVKYSMLCDVHAQHIWNKALRTKSSAITLLTSTHIPRNWSREYKYVFHVHTWYCFLNLDLRSGKLNKGALWSQCKWNVLVFSGMEATVFLFR